MPLVGSAVNFFVRLALWSLSLVDRVVGEGIGYLTPKYYQEDDESLLCVQNQNGCSGKISYIAHYILLFVPAPASLGLLYSWVV
jgi:hypothetical protein